MQDKNITRSKIVIDALRKHYGLKVGEFAGMLGVGGSTVSTWSSRDSLDEDLVFRKCKGVSYDFLLTGTGQMFEEKSSGVSAESQTVAPQGRSHDPVSQAFLKDWLSLSPPAKMRIWAVVKEEMEKQGTATLP